MRRKQSKVSSSVWSTNFSFVEIAIEYSNPIVSEIAMDLGRRNENKKHWLSDDWARVYNIELVISRQVGHWQEYSNEK